MRFAILLLALAACAAPSGGDADSPTDGARPNIARSTPPTMSLDSLHREAPDLQYTATVQFPVLANAGAHTDAVNERLRQEARAAIGHPDFQPDSSLAGVPVEDRSVTSTVEMYVIVSPERLDAEVFSANRLVYAYTGGAHGNYRFDPVNVDLSTGAPIALSDVFRPGAAYLEAVSDGARRSLLAQGWDPDGYGGDAGLQPVEDNFASFTLATDSLVLHFPPYQIGPYAAGLFRAAVAYADLDGLSTSGPLGR